MNGSNRVHVEEAALRELKEVMKDSGDEYLNNLTRLDNIINQITRGDITGDIADEIKRKYEAKKVQFDNLKRTINEADEYLGIKRNKYEKTLSETLSDMG